jgi:2-polyprenyl-3-methyl-5-hydroxy-6-metoxy-1,4-benzoquinol methylase
MTDSLQKIYKHHHLNHREAGFSILKNERGELLKELVGQGKRVLDIGCRDGALTEFFVEGNKVLGLDIDERALQEASKKGIETKLIDLNGDWEQLSNEKFDVVVAGEVLEHLYHPEKVAEKVSRLLNPQGKFIGSVPNAFSLKNRLRYLFGSKRYTPLSDPTHITQFNAGELEEILKKSFSKVKIMGLGRYGRLAALSPNLFAFDLFFVAEL